MEFNTVLTGKKTWDMHLSISKSSALSEYPPISILGYQNGLKTMESKLLFYKSSYNQDLLRLDKFFW